jgi:hypothetical protein
MTGNEWEGDFDPMADPEEQRHILSVLDSFRYDFKCAFIFLH